MRKKSKNLLVLVVVLAIIGIAVGYAAFSTNLTLNGTAKTASEEDWDVHFKSGDITNPSAAFPTDTTLELNHEDLAGTFSAKLAPSEVVTYTVVVENHGKVAAKNNGTTINGATANTATDATANVKCDVSTVTGSIKENGTHTYTVTLTNLNSDVTATEQTATFEIGFPYVQDM